MNRDRVRARLVKRSARRGKGWSPNEVETMLDVKEARRDKIKSKSFGILKMAVSAAPMGAMVGSFVDYAVPDPILEKVPQIAEFAKEGTEAVEFDRQQGYSVWQIVIRDLVPTLRSFENGDYKEGVAGLISLGAALVPLFT